MQENSFGQLLNTSISSEGQRRFRRFKYLLPTFLAFALVIWLVLDELAHPGSVIVNDYEWLFIVGIAVVAVMYGVFAGFFMRLYSEIRVYEGGLYLAYGSETLEIPFSDISGVSNLRINTTYVGFFPVHKSRTVYISREKKSITLNAKRSPQPEEYIDVLIDAYFNYVTNELSPENINQKHITFSDKLELKDGQFLNWTHPVVPLEDATFAPQQNSDTIRLVRESNQNESIKVKPIDMWNESILFYIVEKFGKYDPVAGSTVKHNIQN
ncbi:MAG: hypothetical protein FWF78_04215 [Defluviitaleaceae bacterium]|nr:hypothetical protein [Defluviitaleaceae bacterium]